MPDNDRVDFAALAHRARLMQGEVADFQERLTRLQGSGYGGKGLVAATVSGEGRIVDLRIDPSVIDPDDPETLAAMVIEAVDNANLAVQEQRTERMSGVTDSINGLIAGLRQGARPAGGVEPRTRLQGPPTGR